MVRKERVRPFCQALLKVTLNRSITSTIDISLLKYILLFSFVFTIFLFSTSLTASRSSPFDVFENRYGYYYAEQSIFQNAQTHF